MHPPPLEGGEGRNHIAGKWGAGERGGDSPRELFVHWTLGTPKWGAGMGQRPPQGDAVGHKNKNEG